MACSPYSPAHPSMVGSYPCTSIRPSHLSSQYISISTSDYKVRSSQFFWRICTHSTLSSTLYTPLSFGIAWFYTLATHPGENSSISSGMAENAGFTSPKYNVSRVDIVAEPKDGLKAGQNAVAVGQGADNAGAGLGNAVFPKWKHHEHLPHLGLLGATSLFRFHHVGLCAPVPTSTHRRERFLRCMVYFKQYTTCA